LEADVTWIFISSSMGRSMILSMLFVLDELAEEGPGNSAELARPLNRSEAPAAYEPYLAMRARFRLLVRRTDVMFFFMRLSKGVVRFSVLICY
jgi:hypothetical protein